MAIQRRQEVDTIRTMMVAESTDSMQVILRDIREVTEQEGLSTECSCVGLMCLVACRQGHRRPPATCTSGSARLHQAAWQSFLWLEISDQNHVDSKVVQEAAHERSKCPLLCWNCTSGQQSDDLWTCRHWSHSQLPSAELEVCWGPIPQGRASMFQTAGRCSSSGWGTVTWITWTLQKIC